jgi:hypothetical protein|nr:MAG TPA: hypothetical protein [Crassvirales sp.]
MKKHYETHVEDTDKLISVAGPVLDYKSWYEQYRKLMEEQAQRKYGLYTPTSEGDDDDFPSITGMIARYSALGLTNEQMAENPVWKDLTGNGHDLQMKNFAWGGMSGVGGYGDENYQTFYKFTLDDYVFIASPPGVKHMNFTFRVTGLQPGNKLTLAFFGTTNTVYGTWNKDGIYTVNSAVVEVGKPVYFYNGYGSTRGEFTIEILPLYPGALVFDGVDDYGTCDNFPILTKEKGYTVVALRQWISMGEGIFGLVSNVKNWFNDGAFVLEYNSNNATNKFVNRPISFGNVNIEMDLPNNFTYQTSKSYKGVPITTGSFKGTNSLFVGKLNNIIGNCSNVAIWELVFLDHDATEEELTKIKDYFVKTYPWLFPDQAWTVVGKTNEDEDRATIANITGNGNDLILSNFGFAEGSGYGLYAENYAGGRWVQSTDRADLTWTSYSVNITSVKVASTQLYYQSYPEQPSFIVPSYKIKVYGLKDGQTLSYRQATSEGQQLYKISEDGTYTLPSFPFKANGDWYGFTLNKVQESCDITIEQIPEYEGYLVTDGVDDKAVSKQFKFGENFTVILDFKFPVKKISYCGFDLSSKVRIQNLQGSGVYVVLKGNKTLIPSNVVRAVTSEGKVYDENWNEYNIVPGNISSNYTMVNLGFDGSNQFAESATKLAGIYSSTLSKDDCIKAYNYLQTLKAK